MSHPPHKTLCDKLPWQVIRLSVKSSCNLEETLTDIKTRQSGKQKTATDLHCGFILVGKMTKQHAATGWWFGRGKQLKSVWSLGDMTECLHNVHKDLHCAKIPEGGRTGRLVSITVLLRQWGRFYTFLRQTCTSESWSQRSTAVRLTEYILMFQEFIFT